MYIIKLIFVLFIVLRCSPSYAQLVTVYAEGGDGTNLEKGITKEAKVLKTAHQKHLTLLVISTPTRSIRITPDHPLYARGYGFISFNRLREVLKIKNYTDLVGTVELLVWDAETKKKEYEELSAIVLEKAAVTTYTIRKLNQGTTFIANGFVTSTY